MTSIRKIIFSCHVPLLAGSLAIGFAIPAGAHVTLEQPQAAAGSSYKAVLRVGHACAGATWPNRLPSR
jgi:uncharacterized protein YcnI